MSVRFRSLSVRSRYRMSVRFRSLSVRSRIACWCDSDPLVRLASAIAIAWSHERAAIAPTMIRRQRIARRDTDRIDGAIAPQCRIARSTIALSPIGIAIAPTSIRIAPTRIPIARDAHQLGGRAARSHRHVGRPDECGTDKDRAIAPTSIRFARTSSEIAPTSVAFAPTVSGSHRPGASNRSHRRHPDRTDEYRDRTDEYRGSHRRASDRTDKIAIAPTSIAFAPTSIGIAPTRITGVHSPRRRARRWSG